VRSLYSLSKVPPVTRIRMAMGLGGASEGSVREPLPQS
jgi:hypothetical protein